MTPLNFLRKFLPASGRVRILILSVGILWIFPPRLLSQTPDTAILHGHVEDRNGRPIPGVSLVVANAAANIHRSAVTSDRGEFSLMGLPAAAGYRVIATKPGFAKVRLSGITLIAGRAGDIRVRMNVAGGRTRVVVTGTAGELRMDSPQLGDRLGPKRMEETPLPNRRITYLPLLNSANRPALNQGDAFMNQNLLTTGGTGRRQTWFEVDGANGIDTWGRQTLFTNIPLDAVQEMHVIENAFSPEYGFGLGGVVNVVTRSGTDQYHGDILGLWRPSGTEAKLSGFTPETAGSGNDIANDTLHQYAGSLSGPVPWLRKTHFFVSSQWSQEDRGSPVTSPIAPGIFVGHYHSWLLFYRLDRQIGSSNHLLFRGDVDRFYDTNPNGTVGGNNLPSVDRIFRKRTYSQVLGDTAVLGPSWVNTSRLQFQLASPITQFDPVVKGTQFVVPISSGGTFTSGTSQSALLLNRQYEANDTVMASLGRHQIVFGADVIRAHNGGDSKEYGGPIYDGKLVYQPCTESLTFCESSAYLDNIANVESYTQSYGKADYTVDDTLWALFFGDNFHPQPNLTLNLGLRYEKQTFTDANADFSPRMGFAWDPRGQGKAVVRGAFGIYYGQVVDNSEANYVLNGPTGVFNYTAGPGQIGFPASIEDVPLPAFPPGAAVPLRSLHIRPGRSAYLDAFFPTSTLRGYPDRLLNPYNEQWTFGVDWKPGLNWTLEVENVGSRTHRNVRPLDVDPPAPFIRTVQGQSRTPQAANCTRPYWIAWYQQHGMACDPTAPSDPQPPYSAILSDVNDGFASYDALEVNLNRRFQNGLALLASYTWSHTIDNVDPDVPGQNPNDPNFPGRAEKGNAIFDQRHRFVLSGFYEAPWKITLGGVATLASGLPYNFVTGSTNSGDLGATTDRPVIHGAVVGRNTGRGRSIYQVDPFVERRFPLGKNRMEIQIRAAAFNVFNHANFVGYSGTYGNGALPGPGFGEPLTGITNQLPARSFQFSTQLTF